MFHTVHAHILHSKDKLDSYTTWWASSIRSNQITSTVRLQAAGPLATAMSPWVERGQHAFIVDADFPDSRQPLVQLIHVLFRYKYTINLVVYLSLVKSEQESMQKLNEYMNSLLILFYKNIYALSKHFFVNKVVMVGANA